MSAAIQQLLTGDLAVENVGAALEAGRLDVPGTLDLLLPFLRAGSPSVRDAAAAVLDHLGMLAGGARLMLERARTLPAIDRARPHLFLCAGEHLPAELSALERDEALFAPLKTMSADVASSASTAAELAAKWASLDPERRDAMVAGFETATDGLAEALPLSACVLEAEHDPTRRRRLIELAIGSEHPDTRIVLERIASLGDQEESLSARRALLRLPREEESALPRPLAALTGIDGFGCFEVLLATPRFAEIWELFLVRVDLDSGRPVDTVHTAFVDRAEIDQFVAGTREAGTLVSMVGAGEASEIIVRAAGRESEGERGLGVTLAACARAARAMTRRSMLPPDLGEDSGGIEDGPAFARVGLPLAGEPRAIVLAELETILPRGAGDDRKLETMVAELALALARRFDTTELRRRVANRALHQASLLRSAGDREGAGRAAFLASVTHGRPLVDSPLAVRMIANAIQAELRSAREEPDETALRCSLRDLFFAQVTRPTRRDVEALDLLEIVAEALSDQGLDLPDAASLAARELADAIQAAVAAAPRRLAIIGSPEAPRLDEAAVREAVEPVIDRTLPRLDGVAVSATAAEVASFVAEICLSRCPHRCFDADPAADGLALFTADRHPSELPPTQ